MKQSSGPVVIGVRALLVALFGIPMLWIVLTSLKTSSQVFESGAAVIFRPTLAAYTDALDAQLWDAFTQSMIIATGTTVLALTLAVPAAYALARVGGLVTSLGLGLLIVLQMVPQTAAVIPLFQVFSGWALLDNTLGVIAADTALLIPFAIILLRPFFRAVPHELEEAGAIDGASVPRLFWSIVLPIARNGVATTGTLVFLLAWGEFLYAVNFFLTPGKYPLSALLAQQVSAFGIDWPGLMALAVVTSIPILIVYASTYRLLRDGLTVGAVK